MGQEKHQFRSVLILFLLLSFFIAGVPAIAQEDREGSQRPDREIAIYPEFSGIVASLGETVWVDITVDNKGKQDENIALKVSRVPQGWKAFFKAPDFIVNAVPVQSAKTRTLTFTAEPDKLVKPGNYRFQLEARTEDGKLTAVQALSVTVAQKTAASEDFTLTTNFPVMRGPTDSKFEYSLEVSNRSQSDRNFSLSAQAPAEWQINFKPGYEYKQISDFRLKGGSSQMVSVEVTPDKNARSGSYPILVTVSSGEKKQEMNLTVILTGIYSLDAGTMTGLLSLDAFAGKPSQMSIFVRNSGSADNKDIWFDALKPENWKVEFNPERIEVLEPGTVKQVEVLITPAEQALVGDYSVALSVNGESNISKQIEMRISVKTSAAWGWIGIGIILLVIAGLGGLFLWLGRR